MKLHSIRVVGRAAVLVLLIAVVAVLAASNAAWAGPSQAKPKPGKSTVPKKEADVSITKSGSLSNGDVIWVIKVKNNGTVVAENVVVTDKYGPHMDVTQVTTETGSCERDERKRRIVCTLGNLAAGQEVEIRITADIEPNNFNGTLTNHAKVDSKTRDPKPSNNNSNATVKAKGKK
jgi:uncharacterized repeat protein (TIGR01451 family)